MNKIFICEYECQYEKFSIVFLFYCTMSYVHIEDNIKKKKKEDYLPVAFYVLSRVNIYLSPCKRVFMMRMKKADTQKSWRELFLYSELKKKFDKISLLTFYNRKYYFQLYLFINIFFFHTLCVSQNVERKKKHP